MKNNTPKLNEKEAWLFIKSNLVNDDSIYRNINKLLYYDRIIQETANTMSARWKSKTAGFIEQCIKEINI